MTIIGWVVLGAIAGWVAGLLVKGDEGMGVIGHVVLGIVGALLGGFVVTLLTKEDPMDGVLDWNPRSRRVLEKVGYRLEGRLAKAVVKDGAIIDRWIYARLRDDSPTFVA